jgi:hypothetical protein
MLLEFQFFTNLRLARAPKHQASRLGRPVDASLGQEHLFVRLKEAELEAAGTGVANEHFHGSFSGSAVIPLCSEDEDVTGQKTKAV